MPVFNNILAGAAGSGGAGDYKIKRSLRFYSDDSATLSRTPSSAGNRQTWTWAGWVKRTKFGTEGGIFSTYAGSHPSTTLFWEADGLKFQEYTSSYQFRLGTTEKYRDPSAWYHIVLAYNSTESTASNRAKLWVNGTLQTLSGTTVPPNHLTDWNNTTRHDLGRHATYLDGYLADVHFIDGQALAATDFGAPDADTGVWNPIEFSGTYGNNGFHLDFSDNSSNAALGFDSNVEGTRYSAYVTGFGSPGPANMFDGDATNSYAVSATNTRMTWTPPTAIPYTDSAGGVEVKFMASATGQQDRVRINGGSWVAQPANGGWHKVSTGDGSITSMDFEDEGTQEAVIHAIRVNGTILTNPAGANDFTVNNLTTTSFDAVANTTHVGPGTVSDLGPVTYYNLFHIGTTGVTSNPGSAALVRFNFSALGLTAPATITFDSYEQGGGGWGTVSTNIYTDAGTVTASTTSSGNTRSNTVNIPQGATYLELPGSYNSQHSLYHNGINNLVWNGVSYQHLGPENIDSLLDSPTNYEADSGNNGGNYCVLNPLDQNTATLTNGSLQAQVDTDGARFVRGTIAVSSGKWYWECTTLSGTGMALGVAETTGTGNLTHNQSYYYYAHSGALWGNPTGLNGSFSGSQLAVGSVLGVALDMDAGTLKFYKNGTLIGTAWTGLTGKLVAPIVGNGGGGPNITAFNFGQRPFSISSVPTGYKSLCTQNLDDPLVADGSDYFDVKTYAGNAGTQSITGLEFSPDFVWIKARNHAVNHILTDIVRGTSKELNSNTTGAENNQSGYGVTAFNSNGFTVKDTNGGYGVNGSYNYAAWAWDAGSSNTSISAGSLNSSAYDQSQQWSSYLSASGGSGFTNQGNGAFYGTRDFQNYTYVTGASSSTNYTMTFTPPSAISYSSSLRVQVEPSHGKVSIDGGTTYVNGGSTGLVTFNGPGSFTSITVGDTRNQYSGEIAWVEVDGKLLVNSNVTPPNAPSIASTVRANPTAGFSIVTYTGDGNNTKDVAHGLNAVPQMVLYKTTSTTGNWKVYHHTQTATKLGELNSTGTFSTNNDIGAYPTSTAIPVSSDNSTYLNNNNQTYLALCFAPVEGFSKFGSYIGNGSSSSGTFVWTGFRPRWIMVKSATEATRWYIWDTARDPFNRAENRLSPSESNAESTTEFADILSNGFKLRIDYGGINDTGQTYIYAAFAENPFKTARAR